MESPEKNMDEVEELLQSVQDQLLLNISVDSHIARASTSNSLSPLDSDLDRRFLALKSSQPSNPITSALANQDQELKAVLGEDLSSRFAALKTKSIPNSNSLTPSISVAAIMQEASFGSTLLNDEDKDEENEVDRLIRWAKDAARLDPSPPSDDDEDGSSLGDDYEYESGGEGPKPGTERK